MPRETIRPCLWFDHQAEEAARFYVGLFPGSEVTSITPGPDGSAMVVEFHLAGRGFLALNGGPHFQFNEAISLSVDCRTQAELDALWDRLTEGGSESRCGWLKDRYGLSWQLVPSIIPELLSGSDRARAGRVMQAILGMNRLNIQELERAAAGQA